MLVSRVLAKQRARSDYLLPHEILVRLVCRFVDDQLHSADISLR